MKDTFFIERKETNEEFPLINKAVTNLRLLALLAASLGIFLLYFLVEAKKIAFWPTSPVFNVFVTPNIFIILFFLSYKLCTLQSPFKLFKVPNWPDLKAGALLLALQIIYSTIVSNILTNLKLTTINSAGLQYEKAPHTLKIFSFIAIENFSSLMIEELISIFLFLIINALLRRHTKRSTAIGLSLVISSIIFSLLHFSAYSWHLSQMLLIIGAERLFMTGVYIRTKNIWISFINHYVVDMIAFIGIMLIHH